MAPSIPGQFVEVEAVAVTAAAWDDMRQPARIG